MKISLLTVTPALASYSAKFDGVNCGFNSSFACVSIIATAACGVSLAYGWFSGNIFCCAPALPLNISALFSPLGPIMVVAFSPSAEAVALSVTSYLPFN